MGFKKRALRLAASLAGVLVITYIAAVVIPVNITTVAFAYLLCVLVIASTWGFFEASISSVVATLVFNLTFLPPVGTLTIADPQNWVALFSFLVTSLIASSLSTEARRRALDAEQRQEDLERLYTFGRAILLTNDHEPFAKQLATRLAEIFELDGAALFEPGAGEIYRAGPRDLDGIESRLREAVSKGTSFVDPGRRRIVTAVRLGSEPIASLALQGKRMPDSVVQGLANLVAIGLERSKAQDLAHQVEVARRSERLRTTLIDAIAHEFKTPLTAIRAATTGLLDNPDRNLASATRMLKIADEEAAHLEQLIDNALDIAQLDSDHIDVDPEMSDLNDVVRGVISSMKTNIGDRRVEFIEEGKQTPVRIDRRLMTLAIKQLIDNALKYSSSAMPVTVRSFSNDGKIVVGVTDHGKGISPQEQSRIFERFYRSPSVEKQIPGSGLGLSIAHRILQAHGGDLTVSSQPGETTFKVILPTGDQS